MLTRMFAQTGNQNLQHAFPRPPHLDDGVAEKTGWSPLKGRGRTRRIRTVGANRLEFRVLPEAVSIYVYFMIIGTVSFFAILSQPRLSLGSVALALTCALLFVGCGLVIFYLTNPLVFDKIRGFFWKGRKKPDDVCARQRPDSCARLGEIHAIQILQKLKRGKDDIVYELNLVLRDGNRIYLTDLISLETARGYAETLSRFLERPVWDAAS